MFQTWRYFIGMLQREDWNVAKGSEYLEKLESQYGKRSSIDFARQTLLSNYRGATAPKLANSRINRWLDLLNPERAITHGSFDEEFDKIRSFEHSVLESPYINKYVQRLIRNENADQAATLIAYLYLRNPYRWPQLPISELAVALKTGAVAKSNYAAPILWDIWSKHFDGSSTFLRAYAVEDVWEARNCTQPSVLPIPTTTPERELFIYYMRHVCVPSVLDESDAFQKASEIDQERIRICQILAGCDSIYAEQYQTEIRTITKRLVIKEGLRRIEQSKIHVDVEELQTQLTESIRPEFERLIALVRDQSVGADVSEIVKRDVRVYRDDEITEQLTINFRQENYLVLLANIAIRIWREFATNSHYGLDVYLSTRIRHGTLIGHLRTPIEEQGLMLQRDAVSGIYKDDIHWATRLGVDYSGAGARLNSVLKAFCAVIDDDLTLLNREQIRISTEESGPGWFQFYPSDTEFVFLRRVMRLGIGLSEFVDVCLRLLGRRLETILATVRVNLDSHLRNKWTNLFAQLRSNVVDIELGPHASDLDAAILRAQAAVDQAIDRVVSWFTLSTSVNNPDYTIDLAVDIAAESVRNCFGRESVRVALNDGPTPMLRGRTLVSVVDVFFILLENAVRHGRPNMGPCQVTVMIQADQSLFTIVASNPLAEDTDFDALEKRVHQIKASLREAALSRISQEGGSGFHKLRKIISMDLNSDHTFDFEISGRTFVTTIVLDARRMIV